MDEKKISLNEKLKIIEANAKKLEDNTLDLEESLKIYEQSLKLIQECSQELDKAKNKIMMLTPDDVEIEVNEDLIEL